MGGVHGYDETTYGEAMADVYDEWYGEHHEAAVARLIDLAQGGRVLELGIGTGRLALPLAAAGLDVCGVDASTAMVARLRAKPGGATLPVMVGDMSTSLPDGPFSLVFVAVNTFFNLTTEAAQQRCLTEVARRLAPTGRLALEAFVPDDPPHEGSRVEVRSLTADRVVLSVSVTTGQTAMGQFVELTEAGGVRLRPWQIRWATPAQLDAMADEAGLRLVARWADWSGRPFTTDSSQHVSVYGLA